MVANQPGHDFREFPPLALRVSPNAVHLMLIPGYFGAADPDITYRQERQIVQSRLNLHDSLPRIMPSVGLTVTA